MEAAKKRPDSAPLVITGGDPAGIGPEILLNLAPDLGRLPGPVHYYCTGGRAHREAFKQACTAGGKTTQLYTESEWRERGPVARDALAVIDLTSETGEVEPGQAGVVAGRLALRALRLAADDIAREVPLGLLTAPVSKEWIARGAGMDFPGHTDYLSDRFQSPVMMLMHGQRNSVVPLTIHIPLREVPDALRRVLSDPATLELLRRIHRMPEYSGRDGRRWALCGLNPHAGEGGHLGREEIDFMAEIAEGWRGAGLPVDGPLPADAVFMGQSRERYRLMLSCYHDQGLAPFKALEGVQGVNCTVGLPFARTSPDHGTGFDIAGRGLADPRSMRRALEVLISGELMPVA